MKSREMNIVLIITNIILIGIICSFITKDMILIKEKQIIKEMTETEYESHVEELNKSHTDYATYIQNCKTLIATTLTNEGVSTSNEDTLEKMADNISKIFTERTKIDNTIAATENDIVEGKQAYVNGELINGIGKMSNETHNLIESFVSEANFNKAVNIPENNGKIMIFISFATQNSDTLFSFSGDSFKNVITQNNGEAINIRSTFNVKSYCYFLEVNEEGGELIIEGTPAIGGLTPATGHSILVYAI